VSVTGNLDDDLRSMAGDDHLAQRIRRDLEQLRDGSAGPELAEMACDLLDGRTDLRSIGRSSTYANQLLEGVDRYQAWHSKLTPQERAELEREARKVIYGEGRPPLGEPGPSEHLGAGTDR
jgi:hypothetical protein